MQEEVYIGTRIPEELKSAFLEALEKDGRQFTTSRLIRHWIERYVISTQDQGLTKYGELLDELNQTKQRLASKNAINDELNKLVISLYKVAAMPVQNKDQRA